MSIYATIKYIFLIALGAHLIKYLQLLFKKDCFKKYKFYSLFRHSKLLKTSLLPMKRIKK